MRARSLVFMWLTEALARAAVSVVSSKSSKTLATVATAATSFLSDTLCSTLPTPGTTIAVDATAPAGAHTPSGSFIGFGFDSMFLNNYGGSFSQNLVNVIADRVAGPIVLRIGGTSQDRVTYDPNLPYATECIGSDGTCPDGPGATFVIGPSYFEGFKNFPDQMMSFQVPVNPRINQTNIVAYATLAYAALGADRLADIALGNEPDLYASQFNIDYTAADYAGNATEVEQIVQEALNLSPTDRIFGAPNIAGDGNFDLIDVFEAGLNSNGLINYAAEHWYQVLAGSPNATYVQEQYQLMSHDAIVGLYNEQNYFNAIGYVAANLPNAQYIISESGSALAGPPRTFQDAFGAALWLVDWQLFSMSLGVHRICNTQRPAANHSLWIPDDSTNDPSLGIYYNPGPQVRGPWFGVPLIADFIGQDPGPVVSLLAEDQLTAYAMYPAGTSSSGPTKVVIVNLSYWDPTLGTQRGNQTVAIQVPDGIHAVTISRLQADMGAAAAGYDVQGAEGIITWAGETWSYTLDNGSGHLTGDPVNEPVSICNGTAIVQIPDSEAVMLFFDYVK